MASMYDEAARVRCLARLRDLSANCGDADYGDQEIVHYEADRALLDLICDAEVAAAWEAVPKWYA